MTRQHVKEPRQATLDVYGLTLDEWRFLLEQQRGVCGLCDRLPASGRLCIDHEHVRGFKKMPPELRCRYVRGLLCFRCNRYKVAANDLESAERVAAYLRAYSQRGARNITASACLPGRRGNAPGDGSLRSPDATPRTGSTVVM